MRILGLIMLLIPAVAIASAIVIGIYEQAPKSLIRLAVLLSYFGVACYLFFWC